MSGTEPGGGSMTTWSRLAIIGFIVGTALLAWPRSLPVADCVLMYGQRCADIMEAERSERQVTP